MRYLVDKTYFKPESGPILFYAGNEGDVWTFWDNSGFMTTTKLDKIFTDVHIRRLWRLRVAQQEAFEEAEFLHNFKAVNDRLEAEFLIFFARRMQS